MSLRWSSYVAPKPQIGGSKTQNGHLPSKIGLRSKKVCYKVFFLCKNCQRQSCKAFIILTISAKVIGGVTPSIWNFGSKWPRWSKIADFRSIYARSASDVTRSEKSSTNTNRKSTTRFQMSPIWTSDVVRKLPPPNGGSKTQGVQNINSLLRWFRNGTW